MKLRWSLLICAALAIAGPVAAQEVKIGKLDGELVFKEYKLYQRKAAELQEMGRKLISEFEQWKKRHPLLLKEEWADLRQLEKKGANRTPEEQTRYTNLNGLSDKRDLELAELEGKADLTEAEQQRWRILHNQRTKAQQNLEEEWGRIQQEARDQGLAMEEELTKNIRAAVEQVAKEKGLTIVLQKEVVIYGGLDITQDALKILNAGEPAGNP